jgi:hypothetical protein
MSWLNSFSISSIDGSEDIQAQNPSFSILKLYNNATPNGRKANVYGPRNLCFTKKS